MSGLRGIIKRALPFWYIPCSVALFIVTFVVISAWKASTQHASFEITVSGPVRPARQTTAIWLLENRARILEESSKWNVDPSAVAGVIAYEAIRDPLPARFAGLYRFSGPGKVHYRDSFTVEGDPVAKQVEDAGLLPRRTELERKRYLATSDGAILYIAAIMHFYSVIAVKRRFDISRNPAILATLYSAWTPRKFENYLGSARGQARQFSPNVVGSWVLANRAFLARTLGGNAGAPMARPKQGS